jgi:hypothetical protein
MMLGDLITSTPAQAKGFALCTLRTVLPGRTHELVGLGETNVIRRFLA